MAPLLSVVIPTHKRPEFLQRAIISALGAAPGGDVEVLAVPNGADNSWKITAKKFEGDPRVQWLPRAQSGACAARNHGLVHARGKYVRFLDDDDYLYAAAAEQLNLIARSGATICSSPLEKMSIDDSPAGVFDLPGSGDFPAAALLSISISGFTQGSVFLRSSLSGTRWCEDAVLYDDYLWALSVAESKEQKWIRSNVPVGAYVQHDHARLSRTPRSTENSQPLVAAIMNFHKCLSANARMTSERQAAVATALLTHAHSAFPSSPLFLSKAIKQACEIDPHATPLQPLFRNYPWLAHRLLVSEWAILVPRYLTRGCRRATWFIGGISAQMRQASRNYGAQG